MILPGAEEGGLVGRALCDSSMVDKWYYIQICQSLQDLCKPQSEDYCRPRAVGDRDVSYGSLDVVNVALWNFPQRSYLP